MKNWWKPSRKHLKGKGKSAQDFWQLAPGDWKRTDWQSEVMNDIFFKIEKIAPTDANILILGENGTGKDLIAKAIHQYSLRANKPFVKVDVGALTESLFESELFGHKKGLSPGRVKIGKADLNPPMAALYFLMK